MKRSPCFLQVRAHNSVATPMMFDRLYDKSSAQRLAVGDLSLTAAPIS